MNKFFRSTDIFSAYWWVLFALTAVIVAGTARLGLWQLERAQQREAIEASQQANAQMPALTERDFERPLAAEQSLYRRVEVQGRWLADRTVYLDNRPMYSGFGFLVLTPLQLRNGALLWVQRGWVARDPVSPTSVPAIETPSGWVQLQGRLVHPPSKLMELQATPSPEGGGFARIRNNVDQRSFEQETGLEFAASVQQTGAASEGLLRNWPTLVSIASKNRGYAWQWFAMSSVVAMLFMWFQIFRKIRHGTTHTH